MTERIAIIEPGSNTTRLVLYQYEPGLRFRLTDEVQEVVRDDRCHLDLAGGWLPVEALTAGDASRNTDLLAKALGLEVEILGGVR